MLCCGYTLIDFPISIRLTSLALWQSNDCPSASKATLMNMDKYFMWIHYELLRNHNKAKHNKTVCIFLGIYCIYGQTQNCIVVNGMVSWLGYYLGLRISSAEWHLDNTLQIFLIVAKLNSSNGAKVVTHRKLSGYVCCRWSDNWCFCLGHSQVIMSVISCGI